MPKLTIGQGLWWVPTDRYYKAREATVESVGRKWAANDVERHRINIATLIADGGEYISPGRCYESRDVYEAILARNTAWREIREFVERTGKAERYTMDELQVIRAHLKMPEPAVT